MQVLARMLAEFNFVPRPSHSKTSMLFETVRYRTALCPGLLSCLKVNIPTAWCLPHDALLWVRGIFRGVQRLVFLCFVFKLDSFNCISSDQRSFFFNRICLLPCLTGNKQQTELVSWGVRPCLGGSLQICCFHFRTMDWTALCEISKSLGNCIAI